MHHIYLMLIQIIVTLFCCKLCIEKFVSFSKESVKSEKKDLVQMLLFTIDQNFEMFAWKRK